MTNGPSSQTSRLNRTTSHVVVAWTAPILTVKPVGPNIGQRETPIITEEVVPAIKEAGKGLGVLLLDLRDVTFMASMGLGMCIAFRNQAVANGAKAILFGASSDLLGVLTMMRIDKLYSIAKSEDELRKLIAK